jgi:type II secretory pathway component PulF
MGISEFFVKYWYLIFGVIGGGLYFFMQAWKRNEKVQQFMDRLMLKLPVFGDLIYKSVIARWTRTLATMFAAGVPAGRGARLGRRRLRQLRLRLATRRSSRKCPPAPA